MRDQKTPPPVQSLHSRFDSASILLPKIPASGGMTMEWGDTGDEISVVISIVKERIVPSNNLVCCPTILAVTVKKLDYGFGAQPAYGRRYVLHPPSLREHKKFPLKHTHVKHSQIKHSRRLVRGAGVPGGERLFFHIAANQGSAGFDEFPGVGIEGVGEVAFDTQCGQHSLPHEDGHDHVGLDEIGAEVARVGGNIVDHDGLAGGRRRSAQTTVERDARSGGKAALVRSHDESVAVGHFHEVKADPVVAGHIFVKTVRHGLHEKLHSADGAAEGFKFF